MDHRGRADLSIGHPNYILSALRTKRCDTGNLSHTECGPWSHPEQSPRQRTRGEPTNSILPFARLGKSRHAVYFARTGGFRRIGPRSCDSHPWAEVDRLYVVQADRDSRETESGVSRRGIQSV